MMNKVISNLFYENITLRNVDCIINSKPVKIFYCYIVEKKEAHYTK